jgi:hypothetical protein
MNDLIELHKVMIGGQKEKGRTLTLREIAERLGKFPVDNHVSAIRVKIRRLCRLGAVKEYDAGTRKYEAIPYDFGE